MSEFKYFACVLDESGTDTFTCRRKGIRSKSAGAIRSLVNARSLQLECAGVWHEALFLPAILYGIETMV